MGNYKYMEEVIAKMVERKKPFLIIKYDIISFNGIANNVYEMVTLGKKKLQYIPIERRDAINAINKYNITMLYRADSRNIIWGDEQFKEQFKERRLEI